MLNHTSADIGINLALMANDRKIELTPMAGSLMDALSQSIKHRTDLTVGAYLESLPFAITCASTGGRSDTDPNNYNASTHDTLMDSFQVELAQVVAQQVVYARSVVHTKIKHLEDAVRGAFSQYGIKEAEDFFVVNFHKLHDLFKTDLIDQEVQTDGGWPLTSDVMNFGDIFTPEFDVVGYFATGDDEIDRLIKDWVNSVGKDVILSYLAPKSANFETGLYGPAALDYYMANFLLYRQLTIKQDLNVGLGTVQLLASSTANREYHAGQLSMHLVNYESRVRQGQLLSPDSQTKFSYMSKTKLNITVYEESFAQLTDEDSALEKIFGAIARNGVVDVSVEMIKQEGEQMLRHWKTVRGLYTSYLVSNRSQMLKSLLRVMLEASIDLDCGEEKDSPLFDPAYRAKSMDLAYEYIDTLQSSDADDLYKVCMELMGRIIYRFSNAYFFIREMYEILKQDDDIEPQEASHAAMVRYITDFLLEQVSVNKRTAV